MADYRLTHDSAVIRTSDGARVPEDPRNADWQWYQVWLSTPGNTPDPAIPLPLPPPPPPDANARLDAGVGAALDVVTAIRNATQAIPDNFTAANFAATKVQIDALMQVLVAMLEAQTPPPTP